MESSSSKSGVLSEATVGDRPLVANLEPQSSGLSSDNQSKGGSLSDQSESGTLRSNARSANLGSPAKGGLTSNAHGSLSDVAPSPRHGTLGANEESVSKESLVLQNLSSEEDSSVVLRSEAASPDLTEANTPVPALASTTPQVYGADSKPKVLPTVHTKAGEVWRTVHDAVQRARSENPNHLAVEVRLDDGSSLGVELRMGAEGLQASFRSESQTLLKSIENQWNGFVTKESSNLKVVHAAFEGRSSFGWGGLSDGSANGGERRQQFEDAAASASFGRGSAATSENGAADEGAAEPSNPFANSPVEVLYA